MMDYRKAYGLPERYFLSLGRMVEKKNLSTLVEAYARFARASIEKHGAGSMEHGEKKHGAGSMEHGVRFASAPNDYGVTRGETADGGDPHAGGQAAAATSAEPRLCETGLSQNCKLNTKHCAPALVFVGSGELEGALRKQARGLGLMVIDRSDWKAGQSSHRLTQPTDRETALRQIDAAESANRRWSQGKQPEANKSEQLAADRTGESADSRMTPAVGDESVTAKKSLNPQPSTLNKENCGIVFFYGFRQIEENPVFYALAEAFVLPSLKEEWGLVVNEAMAAGLPVIVSRTAGCAEYLVPQAPASRSSQCSVSVGLKYQACLEDSAGSVQSGENADADDCRLKTENSLEQRSNGFVFDTMSSDALSEALRRIADPLNPKRSTLNAAAMGRRSREIVAKFSCENFARQALRAAEAASA